MKRTFTLFLFVAARLFCFGQDHALMLDGQDDYVEITGFPDITTNFTVTAWINTDTRTYGYQRIFTDDRHEHLSGGWGFSLSDGSAGNLHFYSRTTTPQSLKTPDSLRLADNAWYFVAAVADITNHKKYIYINGKLAASVTYTGDWGIDTGKVSIGGININTPTGHDGEYFNGQMDNVTFWNKALTQTELDEVMCSTADPSGPDILGLWRFNEGTGNTTADESGNGYDGTFHSEPQWVATTVPQDCSVYFPPNLTVAGLEITEGTGGTKNAPFVISLDRPSPQPIQLLVGTAQENLNSNDYIPINEWMTIPANTTQFIVNVQLIGDQTDEYAESFSLHLYSESPVDIRNSHARCVILDDDIPPGVRVNDTTAVEDAGHARVRVSLVRPSAKTAKVRFNTNNQTAHARYDYLSQYQGTIQFAPGETSKYVDIVLLNDNVSEPAENFRFILYSPENLRDDEPSGGRTIGFVNILDDDDSSASHSRVFGNDVQNASSPLTAKATPNPSAAEFNIYIAGSNEKPLTIRITDMLGRVVETKSGIRANSLQRFGAKWRPGIYFVEIIQENKKRTIRLVKTN